MAFRNVLIGFIAAVQLWYWKINPIKAVKRHQYKDLIIRIIAGQLTFGLVNFAFSLIAIGTAMVLFETSPFWVSILSCLILREKVLLLEIVGIFVCFGGVVMLGIGK